MKITFFFYHADTLIIPVVTCSERDKSSQVGFMLMMFTVYTLHSPPICIIFQMLYNLIIFETVHVPQNSMYFVLEAVTITRR